MLPLRIAPLFSVPVFGIEGRPTMSRACVRSLWKHASRLPTTDCSYRRPTSLSTALEMTTAVRT